MTETTALGAAMLAALGVGRFATLAEAAAAMRGPVSAFEPGSDPATREARAEAWQAAVERVLAAVED